MEGFLFDADGLRAEKYIGDGLRLLFFFSLLNSHFAFTMLFVAKPEPTPATARDRNGVSFLLKQQ